MNNITHPTQNEIEFLNLSFNRFLDLFGEIMSDKFLEEKPKLRFFKTKELFAIYSEILKYPPVQWLIESNKRPSHSEVGRDLFKLIRHILMHFPFFEEWTHVWIKQSLVNLYSTRPQFIDQFLSMNEGKEPLKYRFWEERTKKMTYLSVNFPTDYTRGEKIYLYHLLPEKDGIKFAAIFMWDILKVQVEEIQESSTQQPNQGDGE